MLLLKLFNFMSEVQYSSNLYVSNLSNSNIIFNLLLEMENLPLEINTFKITDDGRYCLLGSRNGFSLF